MNGRRRRGGSVRRGQAEGGALFPLRRRSKGECSRCCRYNAVSLFAGRGGTGVGASADGPGDGALRHRPPWRVKSWGHGRTFKGGEGLADNQVPLRWAKGGGARPASLLPAALSLPR